MIDRQSPGTNTKPGDRAQPNHERGNRERAFPHRWASYAKLQFSSVIVVRSVNVQAGELAFKMPWARKKSA
jgi:hypothetical protein